MKRDMDLIRKLVLLIEDSPKGWSPELKIDGFTPSQIGYHSYLLVDSGLAVGIDATAMHSDGPSFFIQHLTSAGHDFADSIRTEYIWDEVQEDMKKKGVASATIDILKKLLDKKIRKHLELD